jgi:hypothetical protein
VQILFNTFPTISLNPIHTIFPNQKTTRAAEQKKIEQIQGPKDKEMNKKELEPEDMNEKKCDIHY